MIVCGERMKRGLILSLFTWLSLIVSGDAAGSAADPVPPEILERQRLLEERLARQAIPSSTESEAPPGQGLAQWYNRWPNWSNWRNYWPNWGNR